MKFKTKLEPFATGYLSADRRDAGYRIGYATLEMARSIPISIDPEKYFAAVSPAVLGIACTAGSGIYMDEKRLDEKLAAFPEEAEELRAVMEQMRGAVTGSLVTASYSEEEKRAHRNVACWAGGWGGHGNPDYDLLLHLGTDGLRRRIADFRCRNAGRDDFYDGLLLCLDALDTLGDRFCALAAEMAATAEPPQRTVLLRLADALRVVPRKPPTDFFSACQFFWMAFNVTGIDSPGRLDQFFLDFYRMSAREDALDCLEKLWILFHDTRTWNTCLSGSDENWRDETNELTYDILDTMEKFRFQTPNVTLRVHRNTPERLWRRTAEVLSTGIGMPALYSDEILVPALSALGIPPADAHDYCMNGCNQIDIMGKSHMGLEDGEISLIKCLEFALFDGVCQITGEQTGPSTGNAADFADFDALMRAYRRQVEHVINLTVSMANKSQQVYSQYCPCPYRSNLIAGCVEKGLDYKSGGPLYNHGQILTQGLADTADSLAAVKYFVFDTRQVSMQTLLEALRTDFRDCEELRVRLSNFRKFGNDDDYVDGIAADIQRHYAGYLLTQHTWRGGVYGAGCSTYVSAPKYGKALGATPNGRHRGDPLIADSIGATPGCNRSGPTAALKSAMRYDQSLAKSGYVHSIKFDKELFASEKGREGFIALAKAYFAGGGQQLSVNVVDAAELTDAQLHPERHRDLIVRVGGYSDYFVRLTPELQNSIIRRSGFAL